MPDRLDPDDEWPYWDVLASGRSQEITGVRLTVDDTDGLARHLRAT